MLLELIKKDLYWKYGNNVRKIEAKSAICKMISLLIDCICLRHEGQGCFKAKVHEQLHVPRDIDRNGSPRESYSGPLEHNHLELKNHSKCTQRSRKNYDKTTCQPSI